MASPTGNDPSTALPNANSRILLLAGEGPVNAIPLAVPSRPKRPPKMPGSPSSPPREGSLEEYQAQMRQWHNRIGKRYRNRLSDQFESLQAALRISRETDPAEFQRVQQQAAVAAAVAAALPPTDDSDGEGDEDAEKGGDEEKSSGGKDKHINLRGRTMNKARVLDMARERIEELTRERERLMREREMLLAGMQGNVLKDG